MWTDMQHTWKGDHGNVDRHATTHEHSTTKTEQGVDMERTTTGQRPTPDSRPSHGGSRQISAGSHFTGVALGEDELLAFPTGFSKCPHKLKMLLTL